MHTEKKSKQYSFVLNYLSWSVYMDSKLGLKIFFSCSSSCVYGYYYIHFKLVDANIFQINE
jgi:hypothetical protein